MGTVIEAKAIISGEDRGLSEMLKRLGKNFDEINKAAKTSAEVAKLSREFKELGKAADAAAKVREAAKQFQASRTIYREAQSNIEGLAKSLDAARKRAAEFAALKPGKGTQLAREAAAARREVTELDAAFSRAQRTVKASAQAYEFHAAAVKAARAEAVGHGVNVGRLASEQTRLRSGMDLTTAAMMRQVRASEARALAVEKRQAPREAAMEEARARSAAVLESRQNARRALVSMGGIALGHKAGEMRSAVSHTYAEYDDLIRYQTAVADLTPAERKSRMDQANRLGASSGFNDLQVLHAQLDLAQRGVKKEFVEPFIKEVVSFAQAMNTDLGSAAKTMEGIVFTTGQDVDNPATAMRTMRRQVDLAVKMAKLGGLDGEDLKQAFKFGGPTGSGAGLSNETMGAIFALLRRSGFGGDEAGTATRSVASRLVSPTSKALSAYDAMGIDYNKFTTMPAAVRADGGATELMRRQFGKALTKAQAQRFQELIGSDAFEDQGKFTEEAVRIAGENFERVGAGKNKGKLKAVDSKALAKAFGGLWKNMISSVDTEGLLMAILESNPTLGQANAIFSDKQGGKVLALARKVAEFKEYQEKLKKTPEGFAQGVGDQRMGGYSGAIKRWKGSWLNLESQTGNAWDDNAGGGMMTKAVSTAASLVQHLAELDASTLRVVSAFTYAGGKLAEGAGTLGLVGAAIALTKSAGSLDLAAARLGAGGALSSLPGGAGKPGFGGLGTLGFLGAAGAGIATMIGTGYALDYLFPTTRAGAGPKRFGQGSLFKGEEAGPGFNVGMSPGGWGKLDVSKGAGASGTAYATTIPRERPWWETSRYPPKSDTYQFPMTGRMSFLPEAARIERPGPVMPPPRPTEFGNPALNQQLEATVKPDQIQANVKPDQIQATARLEGQGVIVVRAEPGTQVVSAFGSGHVRVEGGGNSGRSMPGARNDGRVPSLGGQGGV